MNKAIEILLQKYIDNENNIDEGEKILRIKEKQLREISEEINKMLITNKDIKHLIDCNLIDCIGDFDELMTEYKNGKECK